MVIRLRTVSLSKYGLSDFGVYSGKKSRTLSSSDRSPSDTAKPIAVAEKVFTYGIHGMACIGRIGLVIPLDGNLAVPYNHK